VDREVAAQKTSADRSIIDNRNAAPQLAVSSFLSFCDQTEHSKPEESLTQRKLTSGREREERERESKFKTHRSQHLGMMFASLKFATKRRVILIAFVSLQFLIEPNRCQISGKQTTGKMLKPFPSASHPLISPLDRRWR